MKSAVVQDRGVTKMKTKFYWSRVPGKFVDKRNGQPVSIPFSTIEYSPHEWYETLVETIIDVYNNVPEPTNAVYVGRDVACILECSVLFRPLAGLEHPYPDAITFIGNLSNRYDVYCDPSLTNIVKIGHHNGGSWFEGEIEVLDMNNA